MIDATRRSFLVGTSIVAMAPVLARAAVAAPRPQPYVVLLAEGNQLLGVGSKVIGFDHVFEPSIDV